MQVKLSIVTLNYALKCIYLSIFLFLDIGRKARIELVFNAYSVMADTVGICHLVVGHYTDRLIG